MRAEPPKREERPEMRSTNDRYVEDMVMFAGCIVGGTEAAALRLPELSLAVHVRADEASAQERAAAAGALRDLVQRCIASGGGRDGVIEIAQDDHPTEDRVLSYARPHAQQYCLIRFPKDRQLADLVVAVVVRCEQRREALRLLAWLQCLI